MHRYRRPVQPSQGCLITLIKLWFVWTVLLPLAAGVLYVLLVVSRH